MKWTAIGIVSVALSACPAMAQIQPRIAAEHLVLRTVCGDLVLALYPDVAPQHVAQILKLARLGVYDGVHICRIHPGFVAQLSTALDRPVELTPEQREAIRKLPAEFSDLKHVRGVLSMAREDSNIDSAETSFSILLGDAPHLDGQYTIFGELSAGEEVLEEMLRVPRQGTTPTARIEIMRVDIAESKAELSQMRISGPVPLPIPAATVPSSASAPDDAASSSFNQTLIFGIALIVLVNLASIVLSRDMPAVRVRSLLLINTLVAGFVLLLALLPVTSLQARDPGNPRYLGLMLFLGMLFMIRLMGRFE